MTCMPRRGLNPVRSAEAWMAIRCSALSDQTRRRWTLSSTPPGSKQTLARGEVSRSASSLHSFAARRHLRRTASRWCRFYQDKLGFARGRDVPRYAWRLHRDAEFRPESRDEVSTAGPEQPGDVARSDEREVMGAVQHVGSRSRGHAWRPRDLVRNEAGSPTSKCARTSATTGIG